MFHKFLLSIIIIIIIIVNIDRCCDDLCFLTHERGTNKEYMQEVGFYQEGCFKILFVCSNHIEH